MPAAGATRVPEVVLDEPDLPGPAQLDLYRESTGPLFTTTPLGPVETFRAGAAYRLVGDLVLSRSHFSPQSMRRDHRHLVGDVDGSIGLLVPRRGRLRGESGPWTRVESTSRRPLVIDLAQPFDLRGHGDELLGAIISRKAVPAADRVLRRGRSAVCLELPGPTGRALATGLGGIWDASADREHDRDVLVDELCQLVGHALEHDTSPPPAARSILMKHFVQDHLDDLDLGVEDVCRRFRCSRASVYRAFEVEAGVAAFIRRERLLRCFDELTSSAPGDVRISRVATRWGFENPSHFHRLFKAAFGVSPSTTACWADPVQPPLAAHKSSLWRLHGWLRASASSRPTSRQLGGPAHRTPRTEGRRRAGSG